MNPDIFSLIIVAREGIIYKDSVVSVSSYNTKGLFDVLASHENFISLIQKEVVVTNLEGKTTKFQLSTGLIKVLKNEAKIYLGIDWFSNKNEAKTAKIES